MTSPHSLPQDASCSAPPVIKWELEEAHRRKMILGLLPCLPAWVRHWELFCAPPPTHLEGW